MLPAMPSFGVSICILSVVQGALVGLARAPWIPRLSRLRSGVWAALPLACVVAFVFVAQALSGVAEGLTYLALIAVPPLAAAALAWAARGARPWLGLLALPLFGLAWADRSGLAGEAAAVALEALSCVTLAVLLAAVAPRALVELGIIAAAVADAWLIATNQLQAPNRRLNAVAPPAHLPQLQSALFGRAVMGYEDLFLAALLGALLAARPRAALFGAALVAALALAFDALFLVTDTLPATVPVAVAVIVIEIRARDVRAARA